MNLQDIVESYFRSHVIDLASDQRDTDISDLLQDIIEAMIKTEPSFRDRLIKAKREAIEDAISNSGEPAEEFVAVATFMDQELPPK